MRFTVFALLLVGLAADAGAEPWYVERGTSPVDDSPMVVIERLAEPSDTSVAAGPATPAFGIMCRENRTDAYIHWGGGFVQNDTVTVTTRIDRAAADERLWGISTNFEATFRPQPIPWIRALAAGKRLYARVVPYGENPIEAVFFLDGLAVLLPDVAAACHWSINPPPAADTQPLKNDSAPAKAAQSLTGEGP